MFTCDYDRFGTTFENALVVIDRTELKYEKQNSIADARTELSIQYRVFVSQATYESDSEPLASEWVSDDTITSAPVSLEKTAYDKLKTMTDVFGSETVDV